MFKKKLILTVLSIGVIYLGVCQAEEQTQTVASSNDDLVIIEQQAQEALKQAKSSETTVPTDPQLSLAKLSNTAQYFDPTKYTLGPDDVVDITVMRHPEFSGTYPINLEGKIQYKFVGDIEVTGLTKTQLSDKIKEIIAAFVINPDVNVTILEFKSKVIYVLGEVGMPGKFFMRSETIPIREAVVAAGLPTYSASMRRCLLVSPAKDGKAITKTVDLYSVLYGGDLNKNADMAPGDVLYVPCTVLTKVIRAVSPATSTLGLGSDAKDKARMMTGTGF